MRDNKAHEEEIRKTITRSESAFSFLIAYKTVNPDYKEKSKYINKQWDLVKANELSQSLYMEEVQNMLTSFGGYSEVVEKTVRF